MIYTTPEAFTRAFATQHAHIPFEHVLADIIAKEKGNQANHPTPSSESAMATPCVLYRLEQDNRLLAPVEPWQSSRQTQAWPTFTPNPNLEATLQDLTTVARDITTEEALSLEIEKLCTATLVIDQAFYDVGRRLSEVTKIQNKCTDLYDTCYGLETRWNEHHSTYQSLLWRSREFAGEAQATVDDFREMVLPSLRDHDMTWSEKQTIIREQMTVLQDTSQPSQNLCKGFLDFGRALDTYVAEFSQVVEGFAIGEQSKNVAGLEERLRNAKHTMEAVSREMKELGWKLAGDIAVTGIAFLLAHLAPSVWEMLADVAVKDSANLKRTVENLSLSPSQIVSFDFMNVKRSGLQYLESRRQYSLAVAEYDAAKSGYESESACLCQMEKLESALHDSRPLVQEVTMKLGIFASVWAAITADIRKLRTSLQHADNARSPLFNLRVQRLEKMYGYLSQALRHYQVTVQLPQK